MKTKGIILAGGSGTKSQSFKYALKRIFEEKKPLKFVISRLLYKTGLCRFFKINLTQGFLVFNPTSLSMTLWVYPSERDEDLKVLQKYLRPGSVMVDAGANIGHLSIEGAYIVGSSGKIISIEAHPKIASFARQNIAINKLKNIDFFQVALSDSTGVATISNYSSDDQNKIGSTAEGVKVPAMKLDDLVKNQNIDLLKIDVEGWEYFVLKGAEEVLKRTKVVYFEYWDEHTKGLDYSFNDLHKLLDRYGFRIFLSGSEEVLVEDNWTHLECKNFIAIKEKNDRPDS